MSREQAVAADTVRVHRSIRISAALLAAGALLLLAVLALAVGKYPVTLADLASVLGHRLLGLPAQAPAAVETVVMQVRLPRVVAALVVGGALSAAGATYQGLFRNPLVSPDILGVSAGAGLGAVLGIYLGLPVAPIQALAFAGGLGAVAAVYGIGLAVRRHDPVLTLVLAGVAVGAVLGAGISLLKVLADPYNQLPAITFWLLGSLSGVTRADLAVAAGPVLLGLLSLLLLRWRLNLLTLDEDEARALGVATGRLRSLAIGSATLVVAAVTAIAGAVGWVGLIVPHAARLLGGPDLRRLLPLSALLGAAFLLGVDTMSRGVARIEIPLGILTAVLGTPLFLWLLARTGRR